MGSKDFRHREKKKPKKETRKGSWPALPKEAEQAEVVHPKGKKGEA
ncbi:MAG: hypothetical protein V3U31_05685 [Dehalococcoidia bacterium]